MSTGVRRILAIGVAVVLAIGIFLGGAALLARSHDSASTTTAEPVTINCIGGSEKSPLMADDDIKKLLLTKYGIVVNYTPMGSYDQVNLTDEQLAARGATCLWPSSASAQYVFEATHKTSNFPGYRAETLLQSPEVIFAGPAGTNALIKAGYVHPQQNGKYLTLDLKRLIDESIVKKRTWASLGAPGLSGDVMISSTDPAKSNSGFTLYQLMLTMLASPDGAQSPDVSQARAVLPELRRLYDMQGLQARSSDSGFDQWLLQGAESHAPLYAGYESQLITKRLQYAQNQSAVDVLTQQVRMLYPEPTVYADHPILALDSSAGALIDAMKDPEIQKLAWNRYGFRSGTQIGLADTTLFPDLPLAPQLKTTAPPNAATTQLLLACIRDNRCT